MKKSQLETLIREVIRETIRKVDGKYVVYPEKGGKRLGTHSTKAAAEKQLTAIHLNKEAVEIKYTNPNFDTEWEEAVRYPEFNNIGKEAWIRTARVGQPVSYSSIKDVLGNVDLNFKDLEEPKKQRFQAAFQKGVIEMPIAVKFSDDDYDLVAGNTRLSGLVKNGIDPKIWIVDLSDLQENSVDTDTKLTVLSVIDSKRNLDNDQIRQLFDDSTGGTFYIYTNEEGEYENTKPISRQDAYKYINYYNARLKKDYKKEEELGAELGVLGVESELQFKQGEFKTDPTVFSSNENYADGKVAEVKQEATDSMAVVFDRNGADLFLYDITAKQILGYINVYNNNVTGVAAKKGYGPLMYELGMAHVYPNALQSDRNGNTEPEAKAVWEKFIAGANPKIKVIKLSPSDKEYRTEYPNGNEIWDTEQYYNYKFYNPDTSTLKKLIENGKSLSSEEKDKIIKSGNDFYHSMVSELSKMKENYADGKVKGKSRPGRVKRSGASCKGSVTDLRAKAKKYGGEKGKMYHWCANMKGGKN